MSETLRLWSKFEVLINNLMHKGKHGTSTDSENDPFEITIDGQSHRADFSLATGAATNLWDEDSGVPATGLGFFFWADQDVYLQLIAQSTNVIIPVEAKVPFLFWGGTKGLKILAAADTTAITAAGATLSQIDSCVVGNSSGSTATGFIEVFK